MYKALMFAVGIGLLTASPIFAQDPNNPVLAGRPPKYLSIPDVNACLGQNKTPTLATSCMPAKKPAGCATKSWADLRALKGKERVPACKV